MTAPAFGSPEALAVLANDAWLRSLQIGPGFSPGIEIGRCLYAGDEANTALCGAVWPAWRFDEPEPFDPDTWEGAVCRACLQAVRDRTGLPLPAQPLGGAP